MKNNLIFSSSDKYELVATLGTGSFGTVYLVRHRILECLRAIKVTPRTSVFADSIISEARLLKSLHHSGIPTIYEIEEDNDYYYLIEEYIEGETLEEFLLNQKHISHNTFYHFCSQICEIFCYLHNFRPEPILYMDLKPEHIIVCQMELKLIDFNVSVTLSESGNIRYLFGNKVYSAPEIQQGAIPNPRWDIFGIGKIMLFMSRFLDAPLSHTTRQILNKATAIDPAYRYETVDELLSAIAKEQSYYHQELSCKNIAVIGSNSGCGCTHLAVLLVSVLNYLGYPACYYEKGQNHNLQSIKEYLIDMKEINGCLCYKHFKGYPNYGPGILLPEDSFAIHIFDYGNCHIKNTKEPIEANLFLFVCDSSVWNRQNVLDKGEAFLNTYGNLKIICNMGTQKSSMLFAKTFQKPVYAYPYDSKPFHVTKDKCRFVSQLLQFKRRNRLFFHLRELFHPEKP